VDANATPIYIVGTGFNIPQKKYLILANDNFTLYIIYYNQVIDGYNHDKRYHVLGNYCLNEARYHFRYSWKYRSSGKSS